MGQRGLGHLDDRLPTDTSSWAKWQLEYLHGAFYVFPPDDIIGRLDDLRARFDAKSTAICQAHVSLSEAVPRPVTEADVAKLAGCLQRVDPFVVHYGPVRSFTPRPGAAYAIDADPSTGIERRQLRRDPDRRVIPARQLETVWRRQIFPCGRRCGGSSMTPRRVPMRPSVSTSTTSTSTTRPPPWWAKEEDPGK